MKKQQAGFTLIELIVVIVILGILAATALPRFSNLSVNARVAALDGVTGALRSASAIAHAAALVRGDDCTTAGSPSVALEGAPAVTMDFCYPTADAAGIVSAVEVGGDVDTTTTPGTFMIGGNTNCQVVYAAATSAAVPSFTQTATCS